MTHTSGLTYAPVRRQPAALRRGHRRPHAGQRPLTSFQSPFVCEPGSRFAYGMSTDWTGRVIERSAACPSRTSSASASCEPLGIRDMTFSPNAEQWTRVAPVHAVGDDGGAVVIDFEFPQEREFDPAGHGLYATAGRLRAHPAPAAARRRARRRAPPARGHGARHVLEPHRRPELERMVSLHAGVLARHRRPAGHEVGPRPDGHRRRAGRGTAATGSAGWMRDVQQLLLDRPRQRRDRRAARVIPAALRRSARSTSSTPSSAPSTPGCRAGGRPR